MGHLVSAVTHRRAPARLAMGGTWVLAGALALGACGGGGGDDDAAPRGGYGSALPSHSQKRGGTLKILAAATLGTLDPGGSPTQLENTIIFATQRTLYSFKPGDPNTPVPDLADGAPALGADNRSVRVKLKRGIRYGTNEKAAVTGREVTAADVKYALERAFNPNVANGYVTTYFPLVGSEHANGADIAGITTPGRYTIELKLTKPIAATAARALVLPLTAPVPRSYAAPLDTKAHSVYQTQPEVQAFTGPYMIQSYVPDRSATLVRNPEWDSRTDIRPAYLDRIEWTQGVDPEVAGRQIFSARGYANGDTPASSAIERFARQAPDRISFTPLGNRFVALNTQRKPFSDINVRKAVAAVLDRNAMRLQRGGPSIGDIASHFLPPRMPGFEEAGGLAGPGADYLRKPAGDPALAASYMRKAGYASGKADRQPILMIGTSGSFAKDTAEITRDALESLGFDVTLRLFDQTTVNSRFCGSSREARRIDVCANIGWNPDFRDPYAMLVPNFDGHSIGPEITTNPSLFDDSQINAAMEKAALVRNERRRAKAWGEIDRRLVAEVPAVPFLWEKVPNITSQDVYGVVARWNAAWDLSYMSLKR
jgi:peptide/nickel transport system substrate-binding protein